MWNVLFVVAVLCNSEYLFSLNTCCVQCIYYCDVTFYCPCHLLFCLIIHLSNQKLMTASCIHYLVNMVFVIGFNWWTVYYVIEALRLSTCICTALYTDVATPLYNTHALFFTQHKIFNSKFFQNFTRGMTLCCLNVPISTAYYTATVARKQTNHIFGRVTLTLTASLVIVLCICHMMVSC